MKIILKEKNVISTLFKERKRRRRLSKENKNIILNSFKTKDISELKFCFIDSQKRLLEEVIEMINEEIDDFKITIWERIQNVSNEIKTKKYVDDFISYLEAHINEFFILSNCDKYRQSLTYEINLIGIDYYIRDDYDDE